MSGIAGIFYPDVPKPVGPERVRAMAEALAHRGPDGSGVWTSAGVGLGHPRLAIANTEGNAQPMLTPDQRVAISFDGEIYNRRELRADLEAKGFAFRTESDTEVILAAWRQWGPKCLQHLGGSFAFALYDLGSDSLFLARDRLGAKPLLYARLADGALIFASELQGLVAHPLFRAAPDPHAIEDYLALGYVPDDACIVSGVNKLPAGHHLHIRRGRAFPKPAQWWDVDFTRPSGGKVSVLAEELSALLRQAVHARMPDAPAGAFLTGSLESAAIVAFMAESSRSAVETCAVAFDEPDERAALVAGRFAANHRSRILGAPDPGLIDALAAAFDEPFGDPSALGAYACAALAAERVGVALAGDGADESFAGLRRYGSLLAAEKARGLVPAQLRSAFKGALKPLGTTGEEAYAAAAVLTPGSVRSRFYREGFAAALQGHRAEERIARAMRNAPAADPLSRAQYADLKIALPGNILAALDRSAAAAGLEARAPMLDHRLVEFAARLPAKMRLRGRTGKWLMRKALESHLPEEILKRRAPAFASPVAAWLRGPLAAEADGLARGSALAELGWFDEAAIARLAAAHRSGKAEHGPLLWQLLMLDRALQRLFGLGRSSSYTASAKNRPSGGALKPSAARSRA